MGSMVLRGDSGKEIKAVWDFADDGPGITETQQKWFRS